MDNDISFYSTKPGEFYAAPGCKRQPESTSSWLGDNSRNGQLEEWKNKK